MVDATGVCDSPSAAIPHHAHPHLEWGSLPEWKAAAVTHGVCGVYVQADLLCVQCSGHLLLPGLPGEVRVAWNYADGAWPSSLPWGRERVLSLLLFQL